MKKSFIRHLAFLLVMVSVIGMFAVSAMAADVVASGKCGDNVTFTLTDDGTLTISGTGEMEIDMSGAPWRSHRDSIKTVVINEGVTNVAEAAFWNYPAIKTVKLPNSLKSIGSMAFYVCNSLESIDIPDGVTEIGEWAFRDCTSLKTVKLPANLKKIEDMTFQNCTSLVSADIPESVTTLGSNVFSGCTSLKTVSIPEGITELNGTFNGCRSLTSISIPDSVKTISNATFQACSSLKSVKIPDGVDRIGDALFRGCTALETVNIPEGVTYIGNLAFERCESLEKIDLPKRVESFGLSVFENCTSLKSIVIPEGVPSVGDYAFSGCTSLESVVLPESVNEIGDRAFFGCSALGSIKMPKNASSIGEMAFWECSSLEEIDIPEGITEIKAYTFNLCSSLQKIDIPDGVTSIGKYAFNRCYALRKINIPDGVTSIGKNAFNRCYALRKISIPEGVTSIGEYAFNQCYLLSTIKLPQALKKIEQYSFAYCTSCFEFEIPKSVTEIGKGAFEKVSARLIFKGDAPAIDEEAFSSGSFDYRVIIAMYPEGNQSWTDDVKKDYGGHAKWLPDSYDTTVKDHARDASEPLDSEESCNAWAHNYDSISRWRNTTKSHLEENSDGTYTRVEYTDGKVVVEEYDRDFRIRWKKTLEAEMPIWGGFYSGEDYNFLVFGQVNAAIADENHNVTYDYDKPVVRIVRYTKNWHRVDYEELCGANTWIPFWAGNLSMVEYDNRLYIQTCHRMPDGHQANMRIVMSIPYMTVISSNYQVGGGNGDWYVSHSFNQLIAVDGQDVVTLDHGDAYPRGIVINKFPYGGNYDYGNVIYPICGETGANETGVSVGGIEVSDSAYLTVGNSVSQNEETYDAFSVRNIFVLVTDKSSLETTTRWITNHGEGDPTVVFNPYLIKINDSRFVLIWSEQESDIITTYYVQLDGTGNPVSDIFSTDYPWSDCKPVVRGNELIWYVTGEKRFSFQGYSFDMYSKSSSEPVFYVLDYTKQSESYKKGDVNRDGSVSNSDLILVARHVVNLITLTGEQFTLADMNGDGAITNTDIITVARKIVGLN